MICKLKTWYKNYSIHGSARACLNLRLETDNIDLRDRVYAAINKAMAGPEEEKKKLSTMGFQQEE
jgi:hypothetical protein